MTDADHLGAATGEPADTVCPSHRWYAAPMAPPMAADALGLPPPTIADLAFETSTSWPEPAIDLGLVEGAGGLAAPQAIDGDTLDLIARLQADLVVVVADAQLGVLNLVRLTTRALAGWPTVVHLNRYDPSDQLHHRNHDWLTNSDNLSVTTEVTSLVAFMGRPPGTNAANR